MQQYTVTFLPDNIRITVPAGTSLLEAAAWAGVGVKSTCGGQGTCKRCIVRVKDGHVTAEGNSLPATMRAKGYALACRTQVAGQVTVEIPPEARLVEHRVLLRDEGPAAEGKEKEDLLGGRPIRPLCEAVRLRLDPPTLTENASDWHRLRGALRRQRPDEDFAIGLSALQELAEGLRRADWQVKVVLTSFNTTGQVIRVAPADAPGVYGLAVDLGTTTVAAALVDLERGEVLGQGGTYNRQARFGDDIISRIIHADTKEEGLHELRKAALASINEVAADLLAKCRVAPEEVVAAVVAGNTTMSHLFLGLTPKYIRLQPYIPTTAEYPLMRASEVGLNIHPAAPVLVFPSVASYVGGDIVSGTLFTRLGHSDELVLFVDIGTNGEMVLGNREWLMACACSAGPAFEGAGITCGMRAMQGAIERVEIDPATSEVRVKVIGNTRPVGICGSGLIDALAKLRRAGILDRMGNFMPEKGGRRLRRGEEGYEFVLAWKEETGTGKDIVLTEGDVKNLLRSKGAVFAGIRSLLKTLDLPQEAIDKIVIAGGFGNYLNIDNAVEIGLLPDLPREKYRFAGNTSLKGAVQVLLCRDAWEEALEIGRKMTYLELSVGNLFMEEFVSALFLPHTDLDLFPSLAGEREGGNNPWPGV